jgi:hypothetical protein
VLITGTSFFAWQYKQGREEREAELRSSQMKLKLLEAQLKHSQMALRMA